MGSDESHFNVSFIVRDKVTKQCPQTATFDGERRAEAESNRDPSDYQPATIMTWRQGQVSELTVPI